MNKNTEALRRRTYSHLRALEAFTRHMPGAISHVTKELLFKLHQRTEDLIEDLDRAGLQHAATTLKDILAVWDLSELSSHAQSTHMPTDHWEFVNILQGVESLYLGAAMLMRDLKERGIEIDQGDSMGNFTHWLDEESAQYMRENARRVLEEFKRKEKNIDTLTRKQLDVVVKVLSGAISERLASFDNWFPNDGSAWNLDVPWFKLTRHPLPDAENLWAAGRPSVFGSGSASSLDDIPF